MCHVYPTKLRPHKPRPLLAAVVRLDRDFIQLIRPSRMQSSILFFLFFVPFCHSAGFLRFDFTADDDCLVHLDTAGIFYSDTVRLLAYTTRSVEVYVPSGHSELSFRLQMLHSFSGQPVSRPSSHLFSLVNNGLQESVVVDSDSIILSIRSSFHCENGYFGENCEHLSKDRRIQKTSSTVTTTTEPSGIIQFDFSVSDNTIIYASLFFFVVLLVAFYVAYVCSRSRRQIHVFQEESSVRELPKVFRIDESCSVLDESTGSTKWMDAPSRFLSSSHLESIV